MKQLAFTSLAFLSSFSLFLEAQVDSVNTMSNRLRADFLHEVRNSYIVYLQDSLNGNKYNFEIWDRTIKRNGSEGNFHLHWIRNKHTKGEYVEYHIQFSDRFRPISEQVVEKKWAEARQRIERTYYEYDNNQIRTSPDTLLHNKAPFHLYDLEYSLNWELDVEILGALPLEENRKFAISFYHPGSKTLPAYYDYCVDRTETLQMSNQKYDCWVVKVRYSERSSSEYWIDKSTHTVLQMKEMFYGRYRFKRLIL